MCKQQQTLPAAGCQQLAVNSNTFPDLSNRDEFFHHEFATTEESVHNTLTESSPEIPQQCANDGVDWSSLCKTQKKRAKAKIKNIVSKEDIESATHDKPDLTQPSNNGPDKLAGNLFKDEHQRRKVFKITIDESLISTIQNVIDHQLKIVKLDDEELTSIVN